MTQTENAAIRSRGRNVESSQQCNHAAAAAAAGRLSAGCGEYRSAGVDASLAAAGVIAIHDSAASAAVDAQDGGAGELYGAGKSVRIRPAATSGHKSAIRHGTEHFAHNSHNRATIPLVSRPVVTVRLALASPAA